MRPPRPAVHGVDLDPQTRCAHWCGPLDIIAIKMWCCGAYYACRECHDALVGHHARVWPIESWDEAAVLCGSCGGLLSVRAYMGCDNRCPTCGAGFNPGCRTHYHLYFDSAAHGPAAGP